MDGNLSALIISGYPTVDQLTAAWLDISEQYSDMMGDADNKMLLKLYREIAVLNIEYQQILTLIQILNIVVYKPFEQRLNELLFTNFQFTEKRSAELETCFRLSKSIILKIDLKSVQYKALQTAIKVKSESAGNKPTREYFQSILVTLSDHSRYPISLEIMTYEFCDRVRRFTQFVEKQKAENGRR